MSVWKGLFIVCIVSMWMCSSPRTIRAKKRVVSDLPMTVSVDLRTLTKQDFQRFRAVLLLRKLMVRLTQAGFAVVGVQLPAKIRITLRAKRKTLTVAVHNTVFTTQKRVTLSNASNALEPFHLEVVHKATGSSREARWAWQQTQKKRIKASKKIRKQTKPRLTRRSPPKVRSKSLPWFWEVGLGAMALYRLQGVDLSLQMGVRVGPDRGLGILGTLSFSPSFNQPLTVMEWGLQVGPTWRQPLSKSFSLELGAMLGVGCHVYFFDGGLRKRGAHWDVLLHILAMGNWSINPHVGLRIWLGTGFSFQNRIHLDQGKMIWERSFLRLEGGGTLFFRF